MRDYIHNLGDIEGVSTWAPPSGLSWTETMETPYGKEAVIRLASRFAIKETPDGRGLVTSSIMKPEVPQILLDRRQRADAVDLT